MDGDYMGEEPLCTYQPAKRRRRNDGNDSRHDGQAHSGHHPDGFSAGVPALRIIAERLGITEQEALDRVNALRKSRLIRRLGANFQSAKLGFRSTLCAAKVPEDKLDAS